MLIGNTDCIWVKAQPQFHSTLFAFQTIVRGQEWSLVETILWRDFDVPEELQYRLDRFFDRIEHGITQALNS